MSDKDDSKIELIEETVSLEKERVVTGRVRVTTSSDIVEDVARASLTGERVEVTRHSVGRDIEIYPQTRIEGDTTIIPVVEEVIVVEKRLVLIEEIHVRRIPTTEEIAVPVTLRKQSATVERIEE